METEIKIEEYEAELVSEGEEKILALLLKVPGNEQKILLSDTDQSNLDKVFYSLIDELLRKPFKFVYKKNENEDLLGMNQACEKYIEILDNDLQGVIDEGKKELITQKVDANN